jgi:hypothetical protein
MVNVLKEVLERLQAVLVFADDAIGIEPYEHTCDEATDLHNELRSLINVLQSFLEK